MYPVPFTDSAPSPRHLTCGLATGVSRPHHRESAEALCPISEHRSSGWLGPSSSALILVIILSPVPAVTLNT